MRVLLIKTSSMGDVIHTLPALTDALAAIPDLQVDWVVEEAFADLARRHPAVHQVFPCALRRWRKHPFKARRSGEWATFKSAVQASKYDAVIDAQGLIKSAFVTRLGRGPSFGLDKHSAREGLSARVLDHPLAVAKGQHAIDRVRQLFALALGYTLPGSAPDYGLPRSHVPTSLNRPAQLVFCHGTTWPTKHYPEAFWRQLVELASAEGHSVFLPWGNPMEKDRATRLADGLSGAHVLPQMGLDALTDKLLGAIDDALYADHRANQVVATGPGPAQIFVRRNRACLAHRVRRLGVVVGIDSTTRRLVACQRIAQRRDLLCGE